MDEIKAAWKSALLPEVMALSEKIVVAANDAGYEIDDDDLERLMYQCFRAGWTACLTR
jgi:hypothetical protein